MSANCFTETFQRRIILNGKVFENKIILYLQRINSVSKRMDMRRLHVSLTFLLVLLFTSCYKEQVLVPDERSEVFNFILTEYQEQRIYDSRNVRLSFNDTLPLLEYGNTEYKLDQFELRGESSLRYRRKGFSVNMDDNLFFYVDAEEKIREFEKIKLIALVFDYTYIEHFVAYELFRNLDLWPLFSFYTEVKLNDNTQGIYLCIEDVEDYFMYQKYADFVFRRDYHHVIDHYALNDMKPVNSAEYYISVFDSVYAYITKYSGKQLYDSLMHCMDMPQYFAKISTDLLLKNGDATDELFFYTKEVDGRHIFGVCPWDYDDLFVELPHEIGRDWAVGKLFGTRTYSSIEDIIADVGEKLIFSIEDDLDYKIATDDYLYQQYLTVLEQVMNTVDNNIIEEVFSDAKDIIQPFYNDPAIIDQSKYDENSTSQFNFDVNLSDKKQLLLDRRQWILNELPNHKK